MSNVKDITEVIQTNKYREALEANKIEMLHAIIVTQNELQRVLAASNVDHNQEHRLMQCLIHLKETLFEINLKEYQLKNRGY